MLLFSLQKADTGSELAAQKRPAGWRSKTARTWVKVSTLLCSYMKTISRICYEQIWMQLVDVSDSVSAVGCPSLVRTMRLSEPSSSWRMKWHRWNNNRAMRTKRIFDRTFKYWKPFNSIVKLCRLCKSKWSPKCDIVFLFFFKWSLCSVFLMNREIILYKTQMSNSVVVQTEALLACDFAPKINKKSILTLGIINSLLCSLYTYK